MWYWLVFINFRKLSFFLEPRISLSPLTGQVGLGVGLCPSNRVTEGSNPKGTRLYFRDLTQECRKNL